MKMCCKCGIEKPLEQFPKRKEAPDGHRGECLDCRSQYNRENYLKNRDARLQKQSDYHLQNRDVRLRQMREYESQNKERLSSYRAEWRRNNAEYLKRYFQKHYQKNRHRILSVKKAYRRANPTAIRAWNNVRRARQRNAPVVDFTPQQWQEMKEAFDHRCAYCGVQFDNLTMDHVVPLAKGGSHTASNIVPACMPCNNHKKTGSPPPMVVTPKAKPNTL